VLRLPVPLWCSAYALLQWLKLRGLPYNSRESEIWEFFARAQVFPAVFPPFCTSLLHQRQYYHSQAFKTTALLEITVQHLRAEEV
jgi:hypothetical protein